MCSCVKIGCTAVSTIFKLYVYISSMTMLRCLCSELRIVVGPLSVHLDICYILLIVRVQNLFILVFKWGVSIKFCSTVAEH